jgi:ubiquinone/menaquinone biosynthesis C-methylase UbiE
MKQVISRLLRRRSESGTTLEVVEHAGCSLPPPNLRFCGEEFKDDAYYLRSARMEAQRLVRYCGLNQASKVLDVGCGTGRLAIGILAEIGEVAGYHGIDVHQPSIDWCRRHIASAHPSFRFIHMNVQNERYNPDGKGDKQTMRLPLLEASVDVVNLYSVFSHMTYGNVVAYLAELRRVIAAPGRAFITAFVEEGVPNFEINPASYRQKWSGPLHCVRFERAFFESMLGEQGFRVERFEHGREANGQSAYYLTPAT